MSNTKTIARNTGWYGLETVISNVLTLFTSVAIARFLGPTKMACIIYVAFLASVVSTLGALGIPATTQKYMAEYLGMGDRGTARHIFFRTLLLQIGLATLATIGIVYWVLGDANAGEKLASVLVALSIWPQMINSVPAQANVAMEEMWRNLPASVISILFFFFSIAATLIFKWGIVGVGASMLLTRTIDFLIRLLPTLKHILSWEKNYVQPPGLRERMISFSWQSVASMIVAMVVWDRSEFFLLKHLYKADIRQIAFYSVAFSMAERLLITSTVFGSASGATIYAQYGRDKSRIASITASSFRYLALSSIPVHFISAALAFPILLFLYGHKYQDAALVVTLAPVLCMPRAFLGPVQYLLQSAERQSYVIFATAVAGILDIGVAWYLIPHHGAVGACIGSGVGQVTAVGMLWAIGIYLYRVEIPWAQVAKITFSSLMAAMTAHYVAMHLPALWAVLMGGGASLIVLFGLYYLLRVLEPEDRDRFNILTGMLPKSLAGPADKIVSILIRPGLAGATPTNV
jgi:O-antigen/teichoic acid export membrane protein